MPDPSVCFDEFVLFLREWAHIPIREKISPETQFERDLGITGDDGCELLEAAESKFGIHLSSEEDGYRKTFDLAPNEYLFTSEGGMVHELMSLFNNSVIRPFTVGELYSAVQHAIARKSE
jgi:acyl carrier protein